MDKSVVDAVKQSFGRALGNRNLMADFYNQLITASPEIGKKFSKTDLEKQKEILQMSLSMAILFPQDNVVATHAMDKVRDSHNKDNLDIKPEYYDYWLNSLITVVSTSDPSFTPELEQHWRTTMRHAINHITSGYMPAAES